MEAGAIHASINSSLLTHHLKRDKRFSDQTVYCCKACLVLSVVRGMCHSFNHIMKRRTMGKHFRQVRGNGWLAGWLTGWWDGWMDGRTDGRTDGYAMDGWMDGWMNEFLGMWLGG